MKIIGVCVCGRGEADRYLEDTLKEFERLCDDTIIVGNDTDEKTEALIRKYGFWFYRDDREWGLHQPDIKTELLKRAGYLKPDWIIALDTDEIFDREFSREDIQLLTQQGEIGFYFYIVNLWNDEEHYHKGLSFWNIRFYKYAPEYGLDFIRKRVHCGLAPPYAYHYGWHAPFYVKHYGLMKQEDRQRKIQRYKKYDPKAQFKSKLYYDALRYSGAVASFESIPIRNKLMELDECQPRRKKPKPTMPKQPEEYVYVRRLKDGATLDMPLKHWENILVDKNRKGKFEFISKASTGVAESFDKVPIIENTEETKEMSEAEEKEASPFECPLCDFQAKNRWGLQIHKSKNHK